jgi:hypothetical protein
VDIDMSIQLFKMYSVRINDNASALGHLGGVGCNTWTLTITMVMTLMTLTRGGAEGKLASTTSMAGTGSPS